MPQLNELDGDLRRYLINTTEPRLHEVRGLLHTLAQDLSVEDALGDETVLLRELSQQLSEAALIVGDVVHRLDADLL